jgi:hypothetical protein
MSDVAALAYLETRMARNRLRLLLHQPGRLALWALFVGWLGLFFCTRSSHVSGAPMDLLLPQWLHLLYAFVPAAFIALIGVQIRSASRRPPATFAYPADARFLFGSRLNHILVVFWLQLREVAFSGSRVFLGLFFISWNFAGSARQLIIATAALLCAYVIAFGIRMPVFFAQRRMPEVPFGTFGAALIAAGALTIAFPIAFASATGAAHLSTIASQVTIFPPGSWIVEALAGSQSALFALAILAVGVVACGSFVSADAYPEIWEASSRLYALRALVASGHGLWNSQALRDLRDAQRSATLPRAQKARSSDGRHVPAGALVLLWKDWIALRRSPGGLNGPALWVGGAAIAGYFAGLALESLPWILLAGPLVAIANIFIVIGSQTSVNLGVELRKPLWWLGESSLFSRLLAWIAGATLRTAPALCVGAIAAGIAMHAWLVVVASAPVIWVALVLVQGIGVASYVVLPGRHDMRGPGFMLRILVAYLALLPAAIAWALAQALSANPAWGALFGVMVAAGETALLTFFASRRLAQNAMAFAAAEAR